MLEYILATVVGGSIGKKIGKKIGGAIAEHQIEEERRAIREEQRRNTPFSLPEPMTEEDFEHIVSDCCHTLKRVQNWYVDLPYVKGEFLSQSGMTSWDFSIDFNNYGKLTTWYSAWSDNYDSNLPDRLAVLIIDGVERFLREYEGQPEDDTCNTCNEYVLYNSSEHAIAQPAIVPAISQEKAQMMYCPYCGSRIVAPEARFCVMCGKKIR